MSAQVTLTLSDTLYARVQELAQSRQGKLTETLVKHLEETLPPAQVGAQPASAAQASHLAALAQEEAAYVRLHPQLKMTHLGRFVAIYQGQLLDADDELGPLVERVRTKLPDQVVWISRVCEDPIQTIVKRGNRLQRHGT